MSSVALFLGWVKKLSDLVCFIAGILTFVCKLNTLNSLSKIWKTKNSQMYLALEISDNGLWASSIKGYVWELNKIIYIKH